MTIIYIMLSIVIALILLIIWLLLKYVKTNRRSIELTKPRFIERGKTFLKRNEGEYESEC